jgi:flagellar protein FliO/FliZ
MQEADILRVIISLVVVVLLILGAAWLTRRAGWHRKGQAPSMKVLGAQSLGGRNYVAMVQVEDTRLVLGVTCQSITLLHTLPAGQSHGAAAAVGAYSDPKDCSDPEIYSDPNGSAGGLSAPDSGRMGAFSRVLAQSLKRK